MNHQELTEGLKDLKLTAMREQFVEIATLANQKNMTYEKYLGLLVKAEIEAKQKRKVDGLIKKATLPLTKSISNFDFNRLSGITAREFSKLSEGTFLKVPNNIVLYGSFGVGKTHLAIALVRALCERGYKCYFSTLSSLIQKLIDAKIENKLSDLNKRLDKYDLIACDELGYLAQTQDGADLFFQLISQRYERKSLLMTTNLTYSEWDKVFLNPLNTAVAVERIVHNCLTYNIKAPSKRKEEALERERVRQAEIDNELQ